MELLKKDKKSSRWLVRRPKERQKWWVVSLALRPVSGAAVEDKQHQRETKFAKRIREIVAEPGKSSAKMAEEAEQEARDFGLLNLKNSNARTANNRASEKPIEWGTCTVIQGHPCFANESATRIAITDSSDASVLGIMASGLAISAPPGLTVDVLSSSGQKPNDYHKVRSTKTGAVFWVCGLSLRCDHPGEREDVRSKAKGQSVVNASEEFCISKPVCMGFPSKQPPDIDMIDRMNETGVSFRIKKGTKLKPLRRDGRMVLVKDGESGQTFWVGTVTLICDRREIEFWQRIYEAEEKRQNRHPGTELRSEERLTSEDLQEEMRKAMEKVMGDRKRTRSKAEERQDTLIEAIEEGKLTEVEGLLKNGASTDAPGSSRRTPLYVAADSGRLEVVKLLVDKGADVNAKTDERPEPLAAAVSRDHTEIARLLLDKGADANASGALSSAASYGRVELMRLLLDKGADVNAKDWEGWTPLMTAMCDKPKGISLEVVKLLVEKGADVDARDKDGETVLHLAVGPFHPPCPDVVKLLLDKGANINAKDVDGSTPLMTAARRKDSLEVVKLLLNRGADVNARDNDGGTAFTEACTGRYPTRFEALELLVSRGANINAKKGDATCLDMAKAGWADKELAKWLKAHGAR